jgi:environmental stress-induced protein Ves
MSMNILIPFAGLSALPWKNGSGSSTTIALGPPEAGLDDFDWRISLATIAEDGPFSRYPGVDRTLALVEGNGMTLDIDGSERVVVCESGPVLAFDGDAEVVVKLNRGPTTDFNVMTRSERCYHQFGRRRAAGKSRFMARADLTLLFLAEGDTLEVANEAQRFNLVRYDAVIFDQGTLWSLETAQATVYIVDIFYYNEEDEDE